MKLEEELVLYHDTVDEAYKAKSNDKEKPENDPEHKVLFSGTQQRLPTTDLSSNIVF
jgi:hypothetical protein